MHKFYLLQWTCKLYNPFFRVVFQLSDGITWSNFLKLTLWFCQFMGKRPRNLQFSMKLCSLPDKAHCEMGHLLKFKLMIFRGGHPYIFTMSWWFSESIWLLIFFITLRSINWGGPTSEDSLFGFHGKYSDPWRSLDNYFYILCQYRGI